MNELTYPYIVIDVNIFEYLFSGEDEKHINADKHITDILTDLLDSCLLIDDKGKITSEYGSYLDRRIEQILKKDEKDPVRQLFKHWMEKWVFGALGGIEKVNVNTEDKLMSDIKQIIHERMGMDRYYVYVAFRKGTVLITNDLGIYDKRKILKRKTRNSRSRNADILSSKDMHKQLGYNATTTNDQEVVQ